MSYTEQLLEYAKSKGIDTEELAKDLEKIAALTEIPTETIARAFQQAIEWDKKEASCERSRSLQCIFEQYHDRGATLQEL